MTDKTLGQIAYEAWAILQRRFGPSRSYDPFNDLWPDYKASWEAGAEAVAKHVLDPVSRHPDELLDRVLARKAVIKAAKAYIASTGLNEDSESVRFEELHEAVDALEEAEG